MVRLEVVTAGGGFDFGENAGKLLEGTALGLGVSYSKENGYGGMIGLGGQTANAGVSFYQHGNTSINGGISLGKDKLFMLNASATAHGDSTVSASYTPDGNGLRQGLNIGATYNLQKGNFSGNVGYTMGNSEMGMNMVINADGTTSTSAQNNGIDLVTNGPDGFSMNEIDWAQNNLNLAQNREGEIAKKKNDDAMLEADGVKDPDNLPIKERESRLKDIYRKEENTSLRNKYTDEQISNMSDEERSYALEAMKEHSDFLDQANDAFSDALGIIAGAGTALLGYMGLGGMNGRPSSSIAPEAVARRREDEYDPETGQMLVTDVNGNMKLFYKDEDGNLASKRKRY
jgi:hypothetical protein